MGVQVALDVDRPAIVQVRAVRHDTDEFELAAAVQVCFRTVIDRSEFSQLADLSTG